MNYGNHKGNMPFQINIYSGIDPLLENLEDSEIEVLLLGEGYVEVVSQVETVIHNIFILWEGQEPKTVYGLPCIYKYQSAENIMRELQEKYLEQDSRGVEYMKIAPIHNNYVIGVFSPQGNNKKSLYALMLSEYYGMNQDTLYVNLDLFNQFSWLEEGKGGMSEILYYVKQRNASLTFKINSVVNKYGHFKIIAPVTHYQDLYEITEEDIDFLLQCLREYCEYKVIIIDIGVFGKGIKRIFEGCDKVYMPTEQNHIDMDKLSAFNKQMGETATEQFMNKFQEIEIPYDISFVGESNEVDFIHNDVFYDYVAAVVESGETIEWKNP